MPELPEVEITRENLELWLRGRIVARATVRDARVLRGQQPAAFARALRGHRVGSVRRRAKYLLVDLPGPRRAVLIHLGMAGKVVHVSRRKRLEPAARVVFHREDGERIVFRDTRVFGRVQVFGTEELAALPEIASLGPEPLDRAYRAAHLADALRRTRRPIKVALLDQTLVAGLGNIQAAEALFHAGLHPALPAASLDEGETHRLWKAIRATLRATIQRERAPEIRYVEEAGAPNPFRVYGREGELCPRCRTPIERMVQAARSTYFCPLCQRRRS